MDKEEIPVSNKKIVIASIILVCLIGIYVLFRIGLFEPRIENTSIDKETTKEIFACDKDDIIKMSITNPSGTFSFEKEKEIWIHSENPSIELEQITVNSFSWDYISLKPNRILDNTSVDLKQYGLDNPCATVCLELKDNSKIKFFLGNASEAKNGYYFMKQGDETVYLMGSLESENILHPFEYYRKSVLFNTSEEGIKKVTYKADGRIYEIVKKEKNFWEMLQPYPREVYAAEFSENLLAPALSLKTDAYFDELSPKECGLENPVYTLQIISDGESDTLYIGKENESGICYAMWKEKGQVFGIKKDNLSFFNVSPLTYMQPYVYLPYIQTVKSFEGYVGQQDFSMEIKGSGDNTTYYYNEKEIESDLWKKKFQVLLTAEIIGLVDELPNDSKPIISYQSILNDGSKTEIAFYPYDERNYAVSYDGKLCFMVNKNTVETILENF